MQKLQFIHQTTRNQQVPGITWIIVIDTRKSSQAVGALKTDYHEKFLLPVEASRASQSNACNILFWETSCINNFRMNQVSREKATTCAKVQWWRKQATQRWMLGMSYWEIEQQHETWLLISFTETKKEKRVLFWLEGCRKLKHFLFDLPTHFSTTAVSLNDKYFTEYLKMTEAQEKNLIKMSL